MRCFKLTILISSMLLIFGCGTSDSSDDERFLHAKLLQNVAGSQQTYTLGTYDVPITKNQISLENALKVDVSLKYRGAISPWRENGNPDKDVIVFLISFDAAFDGIPISGDILNVSQVREPLRLEPTGEEYELHEATYYAFFIEGIGDRPEVPVQVALRGTDEIQMIEVEPAKHTLPGKYALHIKKNELDVKDIENPSMLMSRFTSSNNEVRHEDRFISFIHLPSQRGAYGGIVGPGAGYGVEYDNQSNFDYYVLSLK